MAQRDYSFLDIAVLDEVRERFAAADAIAILSIDLEEVIWANGPGAALFGHDDVESIMGAEAGLPFAARRQIMATPGFPEIGTDRPLAVRLASGMTSRIVGFLGTRIALPGGEPAILLAVPFEQAASRTRAEIAARAIGGFGEAGHHVALVDGQGRIVAASEGLAALSIASRTLEALAAEALVADDRLVKRLISAGADEIPAGLARLRDEPLLFLFVAVGAAEEESATESEAAESDKTPVAESAAGPAEAAATSSSEAAAEVRVPAPVAVAEAPSAEVEVRSDQPKAEDIPPAFDNVLSAEPSAPDPIVSAVPVVEPNSPVSEPTVSEVAISEPVAPAAPATPKSGEPAEEDRWYFGPGHEGGAEAEAVRNAAERPVRERTAEKPAGERPAATNADEPEPGAQSESPAPEPAVASTPPAMPSVDRAAAPVRFVWRTDASGRFSALSPEFAQIVGADAADVVGRSFAEVAAAFRIDPSGEIAGLLERRDTWSGRSVLWPIAGTDLSVPVDLAALPVYDRNRNFEGFRGFGVARTADAVVDAQGAGLRLGQATFAAPAGPDPTVADSDLSGTAEADEATATKAESAAPEADETVEAEPRHDDPFRGEVPALTLVPKPERRFSDKIIRLAEHRPAANDRGLTPVEKNAFREIGDRLKKDGGTPVGDASARLAAGEAEPISKRPSAAEVTAEAPTPAAETHSPADIPAPASPAEPATTPPAATKVETDAADSADKSAPAREADEPRAASHRDNATIAQGAKEPAAAPSPELPEEAAERAVPAEAVEAELSTGDAGPAEPAAKSEAEAAAPADHHEKTEEPAEKFAETSDAEPEESAATLEAAPAVAATDEAAAETAGAHSPAEPDEEATIASRPAEEPAATARDFLPSAFAMGSRPRPAVDTSILDKLPVPVLIHSGDVLHYANREFLEFTAYESVDDLAEQGGLDALFGEPYRDEEENDRADRKMRLRRGDGLELPVEALLQSVPWNGGKALLLALRKVGRMPIVTPSTALGVEEKTDLESRIAELRTIIDTATDGVVLIANDGTIRSISRPAEALFGVDSADVAGKPFTSLFAIESQRAARDYLNGLSENGVASVLNDGREVIGREAQGRFIPLFMTIGKLPNHGGYCAVVRDITQWKRAEEELTQSRAQAERASSQKTDFLARVSHEIRTPLNAIIGFSELMMDEKFGPIGNDRYRDYLRDINRSGNHVLDLVNDLLDISKIEAGEQEMSYEAVSLNDTLAETVAMMQPQANRERVIIRSSFASRLPEVVADLRSVRQIALNLLSNAIRYTQAGGQVVVSTAYEPSGDVVMRVRDTGIGMTQAEIEQALKPFKQISALKRGRGDGTGLGLPLTKAMVEANRARFVITSTPGEGTLVEITFPSTRVLAE